MSDTRQTPLVAKASAWLLLYVLMSLPLGLVFVSAGILFYAEFFVRVAQHDFSSVTIFIEIFVEFYIANLAIFLSLPPLLGGCMAILDVLSAKQALIFSDEHCIDSRFPPISFPFSNVQHARVLFGRGGPIGVNFQVKGAKSPWLNDFRIGCWAMLGKNRRDRLCVSIMGLSLRPEQLAELLMAKAQLHGAITINRSPIADQVQKLMPK